MTSSNEKTVDAYLQQLPADRRADIVAVRDVVNANLPAGYVEGMGYGMITWSIPLATYPNTYNGQPLGIAALAAQKGHGSLYLMGSYGDPAVTAWFHDAWKRSGKKLDMGKSCVRFKKASDLALDVIGQVIAKVPPDAYIAQYERIRAETTNKPAAKKPAKTQSKKPAAKKTAAKKTAAKATKPTAKKTAANKPAKKPAAKKPAKKLAKKTAKKAVR